MQEAFASAVAEWPERPPRDPRGWLFSTAKHKAIDRLRRQSRFRAKERDLLDHLSGGALVARSEDSPVPDERLRLIFTCCHPALGLEAQVALTLRTLCGLRTEEIARAFLVPDSTMAQRLVRAKSKIQTAGIPYRVPDAHELPERLSEVLSVVYLVFNEGYAASAGGAVVRQELCQEAIDLARMLRTLLPSPSAELEGLLALMLLHHARRHARASAQGDVVLLGDQDRSLWECELIAEGSSLLVSSLQRERPGSYTLEAAIAAVHAQAPSSEGTDWHQIVGLYDRLLTLHPSPVVALNRAAAVSVLHGPGMALPLVNQLEGALGRYVHWHATRADVLRRLNREREAIESYERAHELSQSEPERRFLRLRIAELSD